MMLQPEEQKKVRRKALLLLEHMDRTEKGLSDRLRQAGFSAEAAEDAVAYVKSFGYLNDERYAENYIAYRMESRSRQKLLQELAARGVDRGTAVRAWEKAAQLYQPDERGILRKSVEKKYREGARLDEKEMRRLYGYLARRGFLSEDIRSVLEEMDIAVKKENYETNP